jgi:molybdate transport system regulatory protein
MIPLSILTAKKIHLLSMEHIHMTTLSPAYKLWMETNGEYVFGPGVFGILVGINKTGTLKEAASGLSMSYRYAWGLIKKAEEALGEPLIHARKGGRLGGGSTELTETGLRLIKEFEELQIHFSDIIHDIPINIQTTVNSVTGVVEKLSDHDGTTQISLKLDPNQAILLHTTTETQTNISTGDKVSLKLSSRVLKIDDYT